MEQQGDSSNPVLPPALAREIMEALVGLNYGSVEIYVQDGKVTQITKRLIKKTTHNLKNRS